MIVVEADDVGPMARENVEDTLTSAYSMTYCAVLIWVAVAEEIDGVLAVAVPLVSEPPFSEVRPEITASAWTIRKPPLTRSPVTPPVPGVCQLVPSETTVTELPVEPSIQVPAETPPTVWEDAVASRTALVSSIQAMMN